VNNPVDEADADVNTEILN